jgi:DNA-binding NarL/FixJ family response regulator
MSKIRVLVVDDHTIVREGIGSLLARFKDIEVVGQATDGKHSIAQVSALSPDVVLMDISMPEMNGLEATREIHKLAPDIRILVLTQHENKEYIIPMLQAGAAGYIFKRARATELSDAIRTVHLEGAYLPAEVANTVINTLIQTNHSQSYGQSLLTKRETEILRLVAEGLSSRKIAERLHLGVKTVETHRANIMEKAGVRNTVELIKYAIREGIVSA